MTYDHIGLKRQVNHTASYYPLDSYCPTYREYPTASITPEFGHTIHLQPDLRDSLTYVLFYRVLPRHRTFSFCPTLNASLASYLHPDR